MTMANDEGTEPPRDARATQETIGVPAKDCENTNVNGAINPTCASKSDLFAASQVSPTRPDQTDETADRVTSGSRNVNGAPPSESWDCEPARESDQPLDLTVCWDQLMASDSEEDAIERAQTIAIELASYMIAGREGGALDRDANRMFASTGLSPDDFAIEQTAKTDGGAGHSASNASDEESPDEERPALVMASDPRRLQTHVEEDDRAYAQAKYGEILLQTLGKDAKRLLPKMDYPNMTRLLSETLSNMLSLEEKSLFVPFKAFVESFCMDGIRPLLYTLVEAHEASEQPLVQAASKLLRVVAVAGNPREVHVMLKLAIAQISESYLRDVCALVIDDLVYIWGVNIPKITGVREKFLKDVIEILDRVLFSNPSSLKNASMNDQNSGGPTVLENAVLRLIADLVGQQALHRQEQAARALTLPPGHDASWVPGAAEWNALGGVRPEVLNEAQQKLVTEMRKLVIEKEGQVHAFETECGYTLALLMRIVESLADRFPARDAKAGSAVKSSKELGNALRTMAPLFQGLGFLNPVDALQKCQRLLSLSPITQESALTHSISSPKPRRNRSKGTFFSVKATSCYLVCALLYGKQPTKPLPVIEPSALRYNLTALTKSDVAKVLAAVQQSPFGLLSPTHALELAMPYVMTLMNDPSPYLCRVGTQILFALTYAVPADATGNIAGVVNTSYDTSFAQAEASRFGLSSVIARSVARCEVAEDREFMMATLRLLLTRFASPKTRFCMLEVLMLQADRIEMTGETVKQLKDAVIAIDREGDEAEASVYRTRLVETVLPRWLLPRKGILGVLHAVVTTSNMAYFIAVSDAKKAERLANGCSRSAGDVLEISLKNRMHFTSKWVHVGFKMVERVVSCAHHDKLKAEELELSKNAKESMEGKELLRQASGTIVEGTNAIDRLKEASRALDLGLQNLGKLSPAIGDIAALPIGAVDS